MSEPSFTNSYEIVLRRTERGWCAGIPELGISVESYDANSAIDSVTRTARKTCDVLTSLGSAAPPPGSLGKFPAFGAAVMRTLSFARRIIAGYVIVFALTLLAVSMVSPFVMARSQDYVSSGKAAEDIGRILAKLNVAVCLDQR